MAVVTFLFSFLARKANDIIQAIFGWSVTALFGRLPRRSQYMVTGALLISLAWPVFVLGAFVPVHKRVDHLIEFDSSWRPAEARA